VVVTSPFTCSLLISLSTGYLAETPEEYALAILDVVRNYDGCSLIIRRGQASAQKFSDEIFSSAFVDACKASMR